MDKQNRSILLTQIQPLQLHKQTQQQTQTARYSHKAQDNWPNKLGQSYQKVKFESFLDIWEGKMTCQILLQLVYKMKYKSEHTCLLYHPTPNSSNFTFSQVSIIRHILRHIITRAFLDSFAVILLALCLVVNFPFCLFND